jgi:hypothetical protein
MELLDYGQEKRGIVFRFSARKKHFSLQQNVEKISRIHPAASDAFPKGKAPEEFSYLLTSI